LALLMMPLVALAVRKFLFMRCHDMKRKIWICKWLVLSALMLSLSDFATASDSVAYYSDNQNDRVVAFDPVEMSIRAVIQTKGTKPYPIGKANDKTSYVTTRNSFSIDVLNNFDVINGPGNELEAEVNAPVGPGAGGAGNGGGIDDPEPSVMRLGWRSSFS